MVMVEGLLMNQKKVEVMMVFVLLSCHQQWGPVHWSLMASSSHDVLPLLERPHCSQKGQTFFLICVQEAEKQPVKKPSIQSNPTARNSKRPKAPFKTMTYHHSLPISG